MAVVLAGALAQPASGAMPAVTWGLTQLVPSPQVSWGDGAAHAGLRWQLTPLLFSWGVNRRVSGWRSFLVEPNFRQGGSLEFFVSPEVFLGATPAFLLRPGVRAYAPLLEHGERLSASLAVSWQHGWGVDSVAFEAGLYALFGILGVQVSYAPGPATPGQFIVTFRLRYF